MDDEGGRTWRVGPVPDRTGLTVRALHHYDQLGLLTPARRTTAGHRLYDETDVARLHRIGFPLEQLNSPR